MSNTINIILPKGYKYTGIASCNCIVADNRVPRGAPHHDKMKVPLPPGSWELKSQDGKNVVLIDNE